MKINFKYAGPAKDVNSLLPGIVETIRGLGDQCLVVDIQIQGSETLAVIQAGAMDFLELRWILESLRKPGEIWSVFAKRAGIPYGTFSHVIAGHRPLGINTYLRLVKNLQLVQSEADALQKFVRLRRSK